MEPMSDEAQMPEGLPAQFWNADAKQVDMAGLIKAHGELSTFKTQHDARLAALPKTAGDYKIEGALPDGVELPVGFTPAIHENDPRIGPLREFALRHHLPQEAVAELVAFELRHQVETTRASDAELGAEFAKLGPNPQPRIDALKAALKANLPPGEYEAVRDSVTDFAAFAALEKLVAMLPKTPDPVHAAGPDAPAGKRLWPAWA
jgi:hypothetical protein